MRPVIQTFFVYFSTMQPLLPWQIFLNSQLFAMSLYLFRLVRVTSCLPLRWKKETYFSFRCTIPYFVFMYHIKSVANTLKFVVE